MIYEKPSETIADCKHLDVEKETVFVAVVVTDRIRDT